MTPFWTANVFDEAPKLLAQGCQNLVLVFDGFYPRAISIFLADCLAIKCIPSKKGINSSRVRSAPRASAIVESLCMAFSRKSTSSCCFKS